MSRAQTACHNPATGEFIGVSSLHRREEVAELADQARLAQPTWAALPARQRARVILRVRDYIARHADELAEIIAASTGKTVTDAMATEVLPAAMAASYYARQAPRLLRDRPLRASSPILSHKSSKVLRVPLGVVGIISPRNYPFAIPFSEVVMGLLAGNAVILKGATQTQLVSRALERCLKAEGMPRGVFTCVNLPGPAAGEALLEAGVDKIFFTGSTAVGRQLAIRAAQTLTPVSLRLGGNDAMLVCPDADLDRASSGAVWAGMQNCGQSSGGVERIYVHRDVHQLFINLVAEKVRQLRVGGEGGPYDVDLGAMLSREQVELVRGQIRDALDRGAVIYGESECPDGANGTYFPATVLVRVDHSMRIMREETFGPVVGVMQVGSMDQAVELANDSDMGLTSSVWSKDARTAEELARRIRAGVVMINDHLMGHGLAEIPWGGFKASGLGRTHGEIGFDEMTQPRCIVRDVLPGVKRDLWWHPYGLEVYDGLHGIIDLLYAKQPARRLSGLGRVIRLFPRTFED